MTRPKPRQRGAQPGNTNAANHGFYSDQFTEQELSLVAAFVSDPSLDDEIWMVRVLNRRLLRHATPAVAGGGQPEIALDALVKVAEALVTGTGRVARLLRDKRALSGEAAEGLADAIAKALDEISNESGEKL